MGWQEEITELTTRGKLSELMGGTEKVERQHHFGKLTIRERIDAITDVGSFREIGKLAGVGQYDDEGHLTGFTPSNFVFGTADLEGRPVMVSGDEIDHKQIDFQ